MNLQNNIKEIKELNNYYKEVINSVNYSKMFADLNTDDRHKKVFNEMLVSGKFSLKDLTIGLLMDGLIAKNKYLPWELANYLVREKEDIINNYFEIVQIDNKYSELKANLLKNPIALNRNYSQLSIEDLPNKFQNAINTKLVDHFYQNELLKINCDKTHKLCLINILKEYWKEENPDVNFNIQDLLIVMLYNGSFNKQQFNIIEISQLLNIKIEKINSVLDKYQILYNNLLYNTENKKQYSLKLLK